jgi:tripartite-type tricarboxylate transporter receptor subunit TctC
MMFVDMTLALPLMRAGQLRALATITQDGSALFSELPSMLEQGLDFRNLSAWTGLFATRNTPPEVVEKLSELLREILAEPAIRQRLADIGFEAQWIAPTEIRRTPRRRHRTLGNANKGSGHRTSVSLMRSVGASQGESVVRRISSYSQ